MSQLSTVQTPRVNFCAYFFLISCVLPASALALSDVGSPVNATSESCAQTVPSVKTLEAAQTRIAEIELAPQNIFNENKPGERTDLFRLANRLHTPTRPEVLRAQLLFNAGDILQQRLLDESARNLRKLTFLREPQFSLRCYRKEANSVEVVLTTRDVWTLSPIAEFSRKGGANVSKFGIEDSNFLGYGKTLEFVVRSDRNRNTSSLRYRDPNLAYSRQQLDVLLAKNSDGHAVNLAIESPFYALDTRRQWLLAAGDVDAEQTRSVFGEEVDRYRQQSQRAELGLGLSAGLQAGWAQRYFFGVRYERERFNALPLVSTLATPENRTFAYPFFRVEGIEDDFSTTFNQDQIGRTEDQAFGMQYQLEIGLAADALGSDRNQALLRAELADGVRMTPQQLLFWDVQGRTRVGNGGSEDNLLAASTRYFFRQSDQASFYVALSGDFGRKLDADKELVLGGENGLRAYPFEYQRGSKRAVFTVEQRYFTDWKPFRLFQVGAAAFVDVGRVWGDSSVPESQLGTLKNVGIGLRLGSTRAARANNLHIDLAYPLDGRKQDRGFAFIVETRTSF
jgi:outer membrane protein assembly factor BamA